MSFLYLLESIRNPFLDKLFSFITYFGEETVFLVLAILVYWCVDKYFGYYTMTVGFTGTIACQFLKLLCHVPRPWVKDPNFTIVESARGSANDFSFPSGHTQNAITIFGTTARATKKNALRWVSIAMVLLVGLSRLYLGVHTPTDVLGGLVVGTICVFVFYPFFQKEEGRFKRMLTLIIVMLCICIAYMAYTLLYPFGSEIDAGNLLEGQLNGAKLLGAVAGLLIAFIIDEKYTKFDTKAPFFVQVIKCVVGFALVLAIKEGTKAPLNAMLPEMAASAIRYMLVVLFAGAVWPLAFKPLARLGKKK